MTLKKIHLETVAEAIAAAPAEWRAEFDDSRLAIPGQADPKVAERLALEAPSDLLSGYVMGLYSINSINSIH